MVSIVLGCIFIGFSIITGGVIPFMPITLTTKGLFFVALAGVVFMGYDLYLIGREQRKMVQ